MTNFYDMLYNYIDLLSEKDLNRVLKNNSKEYVFFNISVFNSGTVVKIKLTNTEKEINYNTWNGYDFYIDAERLKSYVNEVRFKKENN